MNEEKEPIQEMGTQVAQAEATSQEGVAQQGEASPKQESPQDLTQEVERLRKELERVRKEAAERRVASKTLEERLAELEQAWKQAQERAMLAEARVVLSAKLGDPVAAEAALKLARADGLLREVEDGVEVDVDALLQRYPILRRTSAPQDSGANPPAAPRLTREAIASMTPEEYAQRRREILEALRKGLIR